MENTVINTKINFNIGVNLLARIDKFSTRYSLTRTSVINMLLTKGLDDWEFHNFNEYDEVYSDNCE